MSNVIEIHGLKELQQRMAQYPAKLKAAIEVTMQAALLTVHENIPAYPPKPESSTYDRRGLLGKSLGSGMEGGKVGTPDIYEIKQLGAAWEAHFGTNLEYAPFVIGEDQASQNSHWWKLSQVAEAVSGKITGLFKTMADKVAAFLDGKGL